MQTLHRRLSYANVMATLAVFVALGGSSYAALKLPRNSVGAKQLRKNAVTGVKVKDSSLSAKDFAAGQLPRGAQGPPGAQGAPGTTGATGAPGSALAYAHVAADGTVDTANSSGLTVL
ncbi:MAG TPA: collagen-like protein, partial [Solirubrobacteraceae bacterium]